MFLYVGVGEGIRFTQKAIIDKTSADEKGCTILLRHSSSTKNDIKVVWAFLCTSQYCACNKFNDSLVVCFFPDKTNSICKTRLSILPKINFFSRKVYEPNSTKPCNCV